MLMQTNTLNSQHSVNKISKQLLNIHTHKYYIKQFIQKGLSLRLKKKQLPVVCFGP